MSFLVPGGAIDVYSEFSQCLPLLNTECVPRKDNNNTQNEFVGVYKTMKPRINNRDCHYNILKVEFGHETPNNYIQLRKGGKKQVRKAKKQITK